MKIGNHDVGVGYPVFVVAEMSCNHGGNYKRAVETVRAMAQSGADAVKLQVDNPDGGITVDCDKPEFRITTGPWAGKTLHQLYRETYTPWDWVAPLTEIANTLGMECFATPSCLEGVKFLESVGVPAYKVSSFEITDIPLLKAIANTGKPCMVSLGCSTLEDIQNVEMILGGDALFMECVSEYPAKAGDFILPTNEHGISDHSLGHSITWASVAVGAFIVERHFILSRKLGGPDSRFSLEPEEFAYMVQGIRDIEVAKEPKVRKVNRAFCKSLFTARALEAGEVLREEDVLVIRPGLGMHPKYLPSIVGKRLAVAVEKYTPLDVGMFQ